MGNFCISTKTNNYTQSFWGALKTPWETCSQWNDQGIAKQKENILPQAFQCGPIGTTWLRIPILRFSVFCSLFDDIILKSRHRTKPLSANSYHSEKLIFYFPENANISFRRKVLFLNKCVQIVIVRVFHAWYKNSLPPSVCFFPLDFHLSLIVSRFSLPLLNWMDGVLYSNRGLNCNRPD